MHLGFQAYVIGEISTPHTKAGDLLIITSGSGETDALVSIAKKAKESGLYLGLVTMNPQSTLGKMADGMIILPGDSKGNNEEKHSIQPMGSQFEQMSFLIFDAIVLKLLENWNQTSEQMFMRHGTFSNNDIHALKDDVWGKKISCKIRINYVWSYRIFLDVIIKRIFLKL